MRTLKFRIWNDGEMVTDVGLDPDCIPYKIPDGVEGSENFEYYPEAQIMQFTGLTDRHGVEIYEGDLVKFFDAGDTYEICYKEGFFGTCKDGTSYRHGIWNYLDEIEVIGNIYENVMDIPGVDDRRDDSWKDEVANENNV